MSLISLFTFVGQKEKEKRKKKVDGQLGNFVRDITENTEYFLQTWFVIFSVPILIYAKKKSYTNQDQ